ncbi:hypothetical protein MIR68_001139 [Amoeboaphelidium protococcarum]|nr:hypothetical protein MIR68_001139 [Amoeboaphelidium protococcarum]
MRISFSSYASKFMVPRVAGTDSSRKVQRVIRDHFTDLRWHVQEHQFTDKVYKSDGSFDVVEFTNLIVTQHPHRQSRLILAAHYDSKPFWGDLQLGDKFIGALDSAASCGLLLELGTWLTELTRHLDHRRWLYRQEQTVQIVFFDGEEAFYEWTRQDSVYGSRALAHLWSSQSPSYTHIGHNPPHKQSVLKYPQCLKTGISILDSISAFVLLDLIGSNDPLPLFHQYYQDSTQLYSQLVNAEQHVRRHGDNLNFNSHRYFIPRDKDRLLMQHPQAIMDDDQRPFVEMGLSTGRILHLIPYPFPKVWHTIDDNADVVDYEVLEDVYSILQRFIKTQLSLHQ